MQWVEPGLLRLPPSRKTGADPFKLAEQYRRFGESIVGMLPLEVTEGADGEMMINDGVTRATRVHRFAPPGTKVPVVVIEWRPRMILSAMPRVSER
ncbi:MAG: hypothetical protein JWN40_3499 [Phycisphaerales bacterium]|nr:hypothetical protein [Phycisphaerales bacterium]